MKAPQAQVDRSLLLNSAWCFCFLYFILWRSKNIFCAAPSLAPPVQSIVRMLLPKTVQRENA
ncbi:hypothetical protein BDZ91DRAFT_739001 [Kalaharituber pfeilii]|nr:hypothetical protein BDZ91DRAFT_739001 [Kalaharituber pfeilii]